MSDEFDCNASAVTSYSVLNSRHDYVRLAFPASRVQHVSDLHPKFALRSHHVWKYGRHPISDRWD